MGGITIEAFAFINLYGKLCLVCDGVSLRPFLLGLGRLPSQSIITSCQRLYQKLAAASLKIKFQALQASNDLTALLAAFDTFCTEDNGALFTFWSSYLSMVSLLLTFVRSTREVNWSLHLTCLRSMLPWMFAYDRINYARYMCIYWSEMANLKDTHPSAFAELQRGEFAVQRSAGTFAQVAVDQAIEQSINRDSKTRGGIIAFSLNPSAVHQWILAAHKRSAVAKVCKELAGFNWTSELHKESGKNALRQSEQSVQCVLSALQSWQDPFGHSSELFNIASGAVASADITDDCLDALQIGESALQICMADCLGEESALDFHDKLPKLQLKTFHSLLKLSSAQVDNVKVVLKADRSLFAHMLIIAQRRLLNIPKVLLQYELGPLPWSLATGDGRLYKTKSMLLQLLEHGTEPAENVPLRAAVILWQFCNL